MSNEKTLLDGLARENQSLAEMLGMEKEIEKENIEQLRAMAESGDQNMITLLGLKYLKGDGVAADIAEAMFWLEKSNKGYAMDAVGSHYQKCGEYDLAETWFLKAAKDEEYAATAYGNLALMFVNMENLDLNKADQYLEAAFASKVQPELEAHLNDIGTLVGKLFGKSNPEKAIGWLKKSLEYKEEPGSRIALERAYKEVISASNDSTELIEEALAYMEEKGDQVETLSAAALFGYYYKFKNDANYGKSFFNWSVIAAEKGYGPAQVQLAQEYLGKKYNANASMNLEMDLKACERYLVMAEKNQLLTESLKKYLPPVRSLLTKALNDQKKQGEKRLTEEIAAQLVKDTEKAGSTVLRIPEGYTVIEADAFDDRYSDRKTRIPYMKKITEIQIPDTVVTIGGCAFSGCCSATRITLPKHLEYVGDDAFSGVVSGFLGMDKKDKRTVEKLVLPGKAEVATFGFGGIFKIGELIMEEGREEINFGMLNGGDQNSSVGYLYIPDSVTKVSDAYDSRDTKRVVVERVSAPKHLASELSKLSVIKLKKVEYR